MPFTQAAAISIHAPHEGERLCIFQRQHIAVDISIHAPHEGERRFCCNRSRPKSKFQSTLPTRGSDTDIIHHILYQIKFQSTLPTRGSDTRRCLTGYSTRLFQSTLPTRGSDAPPLSYLSGQRTDFNPRSPRGGATPQKITALTDAAISIHAPHEGERRIYNVDFPRQQHISIHAPHEGERQRKSAFVCSISANLLNIIHCGTVTRAVSRRRIALFRLFSVRRSGVFMYAYASH